MQCARVPGCVAVFQLPVRNRQNPGYRLSRYRVRGAGLRALRCEIGNLLPVTIGNIIGGGFFIGAVYWFVYLRRSAVEPVRRLMTKGPPAVSADTTIAEAIEIMKAHDSSSVLVGELGSARGLLDESDIVKKAVLKGLDVNTTRVSEVMSSPLISVDIKASVYGIYRTLAEKRIRHIVITEDGKQVGFISVKDLVKKPIV